MERKREGRREIDVERKWWVGGGRNRRAMRNRTGVGWGGGEGGTEGRREM